MAHKKSSNDYDDAWLIENFWQFDRTDRMSEAYNEVHGTKYSKDAIRSHCFTVLGLKRKSKRHEPFAPEEDAFLRKNYPVMSSRELADAFVIRFGRRREEQELRLRCWYLGIRKKDEAAFKSRSECQKHTKSLGSECVAANGYVKVKVSETGDSNERWKLKHREVWKQHHGEVPDGYVLVFLDGDKHNCDISNLACVPFNYLGYLSRFGISRSSSPLVTKTQIAWCDLQEQIRKIQRTTG